MSRRTLEKEEVLITARPRGWRDEPADTLYDDDPSLEYDETPETSLFDLPEEEESDD